ncbi:bifunctional (p)ppGpp synthetase/guanosine-3',5'-bis(diphosphate) 3'-pyrophosphohydrolase [bacterium]|nr:bifunctional (p)ppGpp synthetase/guanosine-3',5'-bis(diphosphate) 3'-pyrophosphohydrolase [bacterium]
MNEQTLILKLHEALKSQCRPQEEIDEINKAYLFAKKLHEGQYRVSEEPYIIHPCEVALILTDLRVDKHTIMAAFLHDVIEDTDTTPEQIEQEFGEDVKNLVEGVTKLGKYQFKSSEERQAENFRKMFVAMAKDVRVIFLKLADRLHNMRTLNYMAANKQQRIAQETLDIFAPLAGRLGIGKIKSELEDLSLRYLQPEKYFEIAQLVAQKKTEREQTVRMLIQTISINLKQNKIEAEITGRAKHYYSIYKKMKRLNIAFHDLYDVTAVRIIVNSERECYEVLGVIHSHFKPIPGRFKDYIAMPKSNGYKSLHTSVLGPRQKPLEVQIRTKEMHHIAEYGVAAHWRYKESGSVKADSKTDLQFAWMRRMLELEQESAGADDFVEKVKMDLFTNQVFAFTPTGDVIDLPLGATPIDFAFKIHTDVGCKTTGVLINGRIAQLDTKLKNGDIVEILTSKKSEPKMHWLNFAATKQAQTKIRQWFKKHKRDEYISIGRNLMEAELTKAVFDEYVKNGELLNIAKTMNFTSVDDLLALLGSGELSAIKVMNKLKHEVQGDDVSKYVTHKRPQSSKQEIIGLEGLMYQLAKCCLPLPGEPIVGVVTRGKGISVHRQDCKSLDTVQQERLLDISWNPDIQKLAKKTYISAIRIDVDDKIGILKDILAKITDCDTNINYANVKSNPTKKLGIIELGLEVSSIEKLNSVMNVLRAMDSVQSVKRVPLNSNTRLYVPSSQKKKSKSHK